MCGPKIPIGSTLFFSRGKVNGKEPIEEIVDGNCKSKLAGCAFALSNGAALRWFPRVLMPLSGCTCVPAKNGNPYRRNWNRQQVAAGQNRGRNRGHRDQSEFSDFSRTGGELRRRGVFC